MKLLNVIRIIGLSTLSMLLAASILGGMINGIWGFLGGPLLAMFGWFYFPVIVGLHFTAWFTASKFKSTAQFCIVGGLIAALLFAVIGVKEENSFFRFAVAYALASGVCAALSCLVISHFRKESIGTDNGAGK